MKRILIALMVCALSVAQAAKMVHTETVKIGAQTLSVNFTEFPPRAERSLDLTVSAEGGIAEKTGKVAFIQPNGETYFESDRLPRFPRDRTVWGFDSIAFPQQGTWQLEITINGQGKARLPIKVLERPAGPPSIPIYALAVIPMLALFVLGARAWWRVRPQRQAEARSW